jgi:2-polyprenyl-3-methyl-5-hydroxy-6-metoxy-1,4-benzoquinol methylase
LSRQGNFESGTAPETATETRRDRDAIAIDGAYQHRALVAGPSIQRYWHQAKLELLDWFFTLEAGDRVLDVGCGSGVFANHLASYGGRVMAIDGNAEAIAYAAATFASDAVDFQLGHLHALDLEPNSFDRATCLEVIEHVYPAQVTALLASLRSLLRPGGTLLLTTPNYRGLWPLVEWAADRFAPTAHMDRSQHINRYSRARLSQTLRDAGFEIAALRTYSTIAPFASALSWPLAQRIDRLERRIDLPFGSLLALVARNPA